MVPGLWLEPEVIGVRSPIATALPPGELRVSLPRTPGVLLIRLTPGT